MKDIIYCDFSNIYRSVGGGLRLDFSTLEGTNGYCSAEAMQEIRKGIASLSYDGVHVLDNGNYHYMSLFWIEKIRQPFDLIVFDNHTDMQRSSLIPTLSCGDWILEALEDENIPLNKLWLIGSPQSAFDETDGRYANRIEFVSREHMEDLCIGDSCDDGICQLIDKISDSTLPVYISVDKDVFSGDEIATNWDNGIMSLITLEKMIDFLSKKREVIGLDLCGEPDINKKGFSREFEKSRKIDERLINALE